MTIELCKFFKFEISRKFCMQLDRRTAINVWNIHVWTSALPAAFCCSRALPLFHVCLQAESYHQICRTHTDHHSLPTNRRRSIRLINDFRRPSFDRRSFGRSATVQPHRLIATLNHNVWPHRSITSFNMNRQGRRGNSIATMMLLYQLFMAANGKRTNHSNHSRWCRSPEFGHGFCMQP